MNEVQSNNIEMINTTINETNYNDIVISWDELLDTYLSTSRKEIIEYQGKPNQPNLYKDFITFKEEVRKFQNKIISVKETVQKDLQIALMDMTPDRYDNLREKVAKLICGAADVVVHLEKAVCVPFQVHSVPMAHNMEFFVGKMNDLLTIL